jgi:hypothetical protein
MKYLLIHYIDESIFWDENGQEIEDPEELRALEAWDNEMKSRGILVGGGALQPVRETTMLRVRGGEVLVSDGPFAETKEHLGGFILIDAATLDEAVRIASGIPMAKYGSVEVRPIYDIPVE